MLSVRQLAARLGCSRTAVKRAIDKGMLKAKKAHSRLWAIEPDQRELLSFKARLDYLRYVRRERSERMKAFWQTGKLRPRKRKQVVMQVQVQRPTVVTVGQGIYSRSTPIHWLSGGEGEAACPVCASRLQIK